MAGKKKSVRRRKEKIHLAPLIGLAITAKNLWNAYDSAPDDLKMAVMQVKLTGVIPKEFAVRLGYAAEDTFDKNAILETYAPPIIGGLVHTYVGGPKGLNLNRSLRALPMVDL